jgi:hypothetical protein
VPALAKCTENPYVVPVGGVKKTPTRRERPAAGRRRSRKSLRDKAKKMFDTRPGLLYDMSIGRP